MKLRPGDTTVLHVVAGGPAQRAGLSGGDVLVSLDGLKASPSRWTQRVGDLVPGRVYSVHYFRGDELLETKLTAERPGDDTWTFVLADADGDVLARRRAWLGA